LRIAPHPPYMPDLAPSDFSCFLLRHLKNRLQGQQVGSAYELLSGFQDIPAEIIVDTLEAVVREWINRLDRCIAVLQQMESICNDVNTHLLSYSWRRSDLEILIPSWDTLYLLCSPRELAGWDSPCAYISCIRPPKSRSSTILFRTNWNSRTRISINASASS
jgi:hypothetical protein